MEKTSKRSGSGMLLRATFVSLLMPAFPFTANSTALAELKVDYATIRQDRYPVPVETWQWAEGWGEVRQYFPRYFKTSATVHVFLRNDGNTVVEITQLGFNGQPIESVCTAAGYAGAVIWYRTNPEVIQPGQMGMIYVRLRHRPTKPVEITITTKDGQTVPVRLTEADSSQIRLGYVGFSHNIDTIYVYVDRYTDRRLRVDRIYLDGKDVTAKSQVINPTFSGGPALVEISPAEPLIYGSYHCIKVTTHEGPVAMYQVRARDDRFLRMMVTGRTGLKGLHAKFFNAKYSIHGSHPKKPNWWDADNDLARLGFTWVSPSANEAAVKAGATVPPGRIMYTNMDEPDAHESWAGLPFWEVSGTNCMAVERTMRMQRRLDPYHETTVIVDRTFAPMNWLHYGELPDVFMHDCYAPTQWMGYDLEVFIHETAAVTAACEPRPAHIMLWGLLATGYRMRRSPTPEENDLSVHYLLGGGAKGVSYFCDWDSYPTEVEDGYFVATSRTNMFWKNIGRMNAKMTRLGSLLAIGHRFNIARADDEKLWTSSLLCGKDHFVIVLVNRKHRIHVGARFTRQPYIFPMKNATVTVDLPEWFNPKAAVHVTWDDVRPIKLSGQDRRRKLRIDRLKTSMVVVLSQDPKIAEKLTVDPGQFAALLESEKPTYVTDNPPIENVERPDTVIRLDEATLAKGTLALDLTDAVTLARAMRIRTEGRLRRVPGKWLGLFTAADWHGEAEIVFRFEAAVALKKIDAKLHSQTPNFAACAHNIVGVSVDDKRYVQDSSFKAKWNGGGRGGEHLAVSREAGKGEPIRTFFVRVLLRDPGIVASDEATNIAKSLTVSWKRADYTKIAEGSP